MHTEFMTLEQTRDMLQDLLQSSGPFFDADGVLRGAFNVRTLAPFTAEWGQTQTQPKLPEPLAIDYAQATMYEDTWDASGNYLEYLRARYDVTGEPHLLGEMHRIAQMAVDVYREDNQNLLWEWEARAGFMRQLYAGRYGTWPYPETLGTDQFSPLMWGLQQVYEYLDTATRADIEELLIGTLGWFMRRNFAYVYRGTIIHHIDWGEHALAYYIPALAWAYQVTGETSYLKAYEQLHTQYLYNPDHYLRNDKLRPIVYYQSAFKWSMWIPWLCEHAPNAHFYQLLFPDFVAWYTTLLHNTLPEGLGHDYDNGRSVYSTDPYPKEWMNIPLVPDPNVKTHDGYDMQAYCDRACKPPLRQIRYLSSFALARPNEVDVTPIRKILACCNTLDHFTYWYDPEDKVVPRHMNHRSWSLQAQFVLCWLIAYWRLRKLGG